MYRSASLLAVMALAAVSAHAASITPEGSFGTLAGATFNGTNVSSGIPNTAVEKASGAFGIIGLTAHQRLTGPNLANDGAGSFTAFSGPGTTPGYSTWNVGFYINPNDLGNSEVTNSRYGYRLYYDFAPAAGTDKSAHGVFDFGVLGDAKQDSWNMGMSFLTLNIPGLIAPPAGTFNANVNGTYTFQLAAYDTNPGVREAFGEIGRVAISVSAVPEPETYALMVAGLGLLGFVARRRRA